MPKTVGSGTRILTYVRKRQLFTTARIHVTAEYLFRPPQSIKNDDFNARSYPSSAESYPRTNPAIHAPNN